MRLNFRPIGLLERRKRLTAKLLRRPGENLHFCRWVVRHALYGFAGLGLRDEHSVFEIDRRLAVDIFRMPRNVSDLLPDAHPYHGRPGVVAVMPDNQSKSRLAANPAYLSTQPHPENRRNRKLTHDFLAGCRIDRGFDKLAGRETNSRRKVMFDDSGRW